jgi:hypothetical protein
VPRDVTRVCWLDGSRTESVIQTTIETEVWVPRAGLPYLERVRVRTVDEVHAMILAVVGEPVPGYPGLTRIEAVGEGFSVMPCLPSGQEWPAGRTVVYPVTGTSEGDYIHVGVVGRDGAYQTLLIGKTFAGRDAAWAFARRLADLLGCDMRA